MACQCAWAAARAKNTLLSAQFRRVAAERGSKRAIIAVAHSLVIIGYNLRENQRNYEDLGGDYFDRIPSDGLKRHFVGRLEKLGHKVTLVPIKPARLICSGAHDSGAVWIQYAALVMRYAYEVSQTRMRSLIIVRRGISRVAAMRWRIRFDGCAQGRVESSESGWRSPSADQRTQG
jgi:hypothetical protein